jgi:hypothetical protein
MNSIEDCVKNYLFLLKLEVAMKLKRRGVISVGEFEKLLTEEVRKVCPNQQNLGGYLVYFLDIIDINGEKVVLSRDGEHYVEVIEKLQGTS